MSPRSDVYYASAEIGHVTTDDIEQSIGLFSTPGGMPVYGHAVLVSGETNDPSDLEACSDGIAGKLERMLTEHLIAS